MPYGTVNTDIVADSSGGRLAPISSVFRNRIINGAMVIDQRNGGAAVTQSTGAQYVTDRFQILGNVASKFTAQQVNVPATLSGFTKCLKITSSSAYTVGAGEYFMMRQPIEGYNIADLGWGTANAKTVTLSFQVYSSLTGTFGGAIENSAADRCYPFSYSIPVANTWTTISVTIAGDTTGTWLTDNGIGIQLAFGLGVGSTYSGTAGSWGTTRYFSATGATSVVGTSGATFYITGVQLEVGSSATGFEYRQYGQELALCQRYYEIGTNFVDAGYVPTNTPVSFAGSTFAVTKRTAPTTVFTAATATNAYGGTTRTNYVNGFWRYVLATATGAVACSETWTASAEL